MTPAQDHGLWIAEMDVDDEWYRLRAKPQPADFEHTGINTLTDHFRCIGDGDGVDPNPCFLLSHYLTESRYWERAPGWTPCEDYVRRSGVSGWSPHWLFDEARFQRLYPRVTDAVAKRNLVSGYMHFMRSRTPAEYSPHLLFNAAHYAKQAELAPGIHPFRHFLSVGQFKGLSPHPLFDPDYYCRFDGIADPIGREKHYTSPLHHFIMRGNQDGRVPTPDFDAEFYLDRNPDVREAMQAGHYSSAFVHFLEEGQREGRQPNPFFDEHDYIWYNPGIRDEAKALGFNSAFEHFLAIGARQGLRAHRPAFSVKVPDVHAKGIFEQRSRIVSQLLLRDGLAMPAAEQPHVSFVVPVHNNLMFTIALLGQLEREGRAAPHIPLEVIVVDNGSTDRTTELETVVAGVRVIRSKEPLGYTVACNVGAAAARGDILVFVNNDIELTPGLLPRIVRSLENPEVGISGARIVNAGGRLQEAGSLLWQDGSANGYGRGEDPTDAAFLVPRDVDYVSGCFLCIRRELFQTVGGFDERFSPGYYEDTDLCLAVRAHGLRVLYDPSLVIFHYEYASYGKGRPPATLEALMERKRKLFVAKHRELLKSQPARGDLPLPLAVFHPTRHAPRRVLLIEDRLPGETLGSGFTRTFDVLGAMTRAGMAVSLWALHERVVVEVPSWTRGACSILPQIDGPQSVSELLRDYGDDFDLVWVCRSHNYCSLRTDLARWRQARTNRRLVVDTEAVAALRTASLFARSGNPMDEAVLLDVVREELPNLASADTVVAVNDLDAEWLSRAFSVEPVLLGHRFTMSAGDAGFAERSGLLFVGSIMGTDTPNHDSLVWFIKAILPEVVVRIPDIRFTVIGHGSRDLLSIGTPLSDQIDWRGEVAQLRDAFGSARVFVAPTRFAGGLPHKVENAAAHGLPVVTSPLLAEQLRRRPDDPFPFHPSDWSSRAFAECVVQLYTDDALWQRYRQFGLQHVAEASDPQEFDAKIIGIVNG
jgi:O-antigen biosynthesis protein